MNRKQQSVVLASLLALALAGCSSMRGSSDETGGTGAGATGSGSGTSGTSGATGSGGASSGSGGSASTRGADSAGGMAGAGSGSMGSTQAQSQSPSQAQTPATGSPDTSMTPAAMPNAVVMLIESMPRQGAGAVGGSGTTGATGSSMGDDKSFRVTLRMDDGTTRIVTQDKAPTYRQGDRVNMMDGVISH